ncbi:MAG: response regulator [Sandaracinaceae bacterium]
MLRALSEQHGLPGIDLAQVVIPVENLKLVPQDIAKQYLILPFSVKDEHLFLAMADPSDQRVVEEIEFVTGRKVFPYIAVQAVLKRSIENAYAALNRGDTFYVGPNAPPEYLAELGLAAPPPVPADDGSGLHETGAAPVGRQGPRKVPTLDEAFGSRVDVMPSSRPESRGVAGARKTLLIVDDEEDIRRMLRRVLVERGIDVVEASRGSEALQAVRDHDPDVILLDAMLPEIHGFDICRRIKASRTYGHIPVIMVSAIYRGWRFAEDLKQSYGVFEFMEKPFKISNVVDAVERALDGRGPDEQLEELSAEAARLLSRGIESYRQGALDAAIEQLQKGLVIDPLAFRLHYHLGLLYGRREKLFEGIQALETAVDLSPRNFSALKNLAVLYQRAGFKRKAIELWERAMGSAPDDETRRGIRDHLVSLL